MRSEQSKMSNTEVKLLKERLLNARREVLLIVTDVIAVLGENGHGKEVGGISDTRIMRFIIDKAQGPRAPFTFRECASIRLALFHVEIVVKD